MYKERTKQPCETKATVEMIIFGKPANEKIAAATPLYRKCYIFWQKQVESF